MTAALPAAPILTHVRRNAQAHDQFIAGGGGLLSSAEAAELAGFGAANRVQLAQGGAGFRGRLPRPAVLTGAAVRPRAVVRELIASLAPFYSGCALVLSTDESMR